MTVRSWKGYSSAGRPVVGAGGRPVELGRVAHVQSLVRALVVVDAGEGIEARLLLQEVFSGRLGGFLLQGQMHNVRACRSARGVPV